MRTLLTSTIVMAVLSTAIVFANSNDRSHVFAKTQNQSQIPAGLMTVRTLLESHVEYEILGLDKDAPYRVAIKPKRCSDSSPMFSDDEDAMVVSSQFGAIQGFYEKDDLATTTSVFIARLDNIGSRQVQWSGCLSLNS